MLTKGQREVLECIINMGATQEKEIQVTSTEIGEITSQHRASVSNYINALHLKGKIIKRRSGAEIYVKLPSVKMKNKNADKLTPIKQSINIGDSIELTLLRPAIGTDSKIKGEVIALTEEVFVVMGKKHGKELYKESFSYKDILIKDIQEVKVNGKPIAH
ncbi:hypothetical protein [Hathewaya massiliensis]|uniref:hypothetical protein n=1 Tax=Hathewaya massiliensis TaxID=1964382 RepID=UPI00115C0D1A|nr:hypothetical protein [Hathewaya massiliensis]